MLMKDSVGFTRIIRTANETCCRNFLIIVLFWKYAPPPPLWSLDFTLSMFYFWGYLKSVVIQNNPQTLEGEYWKRNIKHRWTNIMALVQMPWKVYKPVPRLMAITFSVYFKAKATVCVFYTDYIHIINTRLQDCIPYEVLLSNTCKVILYIIKSLLDQSERKL